MLSRGDLGVPRDWGVRRPPSERRGTLAGRGISEREECRGESVGSPELRAAWAAGAFGVRHALYVDGGRGTGERPAWESGQSTELLGSQACRGGGTLSWRPRECESSDRGCGCSNWGCGCSDGGTILCGYLNSFPNCHEPLKIFVFFFVVCVCYSPL